MRGESKGGPDGVQGRVQEGGQEGVQETDVSGMQEWGRDTAVGSAVGSALVSPSDNFYEVVKFWVRVRGLG